VLGDGIEEEVRRGVVEEEAGSILFMRRVGSNGVRNLRRAPSRGRRDQRGAWTRPALTQGL
jgi:hypothetical protein